MGRRQRAVEVRRLRFESVQRIADSKIYILIQYGHDLFAPDLPQGWIEDRMRSVAIDICRGEPSRNNLVHAGPRQIDRSGHRLGMKITKNAVHQDSDFQSWYFEIRNLGGAKLHAVTREK